MRSWVVAVCAALFVTLCGATQAQEGPSRAPTSIVDVKPLPSAANPQAGFDALKATNAYLGQIKGEARRKSDSYFEGGYVLLLVDAVYAVIVSLIILSLGWSAWMRDMAARIMPWRALQVPVYAIAYLALTTVMGFPLLVYEQFFREHAYGLSNQTFPQWLGDYLTLLPVNFIVFVLLITVIYALIRRTPRYWWVWGTIVTVIFLMIGAMLAPVYIAPLVNKYYPLKEGPLKSEILSLARAEGVPATNVYEFDASKQTKRVSANVSGLFGTTRISLNDNLINRCTHDEIIAVLGHEMGHYVLDHAALLITWNGLLFLAGFGFVQWGFGWTLRAFGGRWGVKGIDDPAGLPVIMALVSVFGLLTTPVSNTITRTAEAQADIFGVNAVRQPDGFAKAALMLSEYRKLDPTPLEEFIFFDHPSGRSRIYMMMRWKAEHLNDPDIRNGPVSPQ